MYKKIILLGLVGTITISGLGILESAGSPKEEITYVVQKGDTLWSIAADHTNDEMDIRSMIYDIKQKNDLNSAELTVGQKLKINKKIDSSIDR